MPQRHAKLIEVALCQIGQDFSIDFALAKRGLILTETEAAQPSPDIHDCIRPAGINDGLIERACPGYWPRMTAPGHPTADLRIWVSNVWFTTSDVVRLLQSRRQ